MALFQWGGEEGSHSNRCTARGIIKELEPSVDSVAGQQRAELRWGESKGTHEGKVAAPITSQMLVCRGPATLLAGTRAPVSDGVRTGPFKAALLSEHRLEATQISIHGKPGMAIHIREYHGALRDREREIEFSAFMY